MTELCLTVELCSPLILHQQRASTQFSATLDYIPGSTLRGALAALFLRGNPRRAQDPDFRSLFLEDRVFYPDLLPALNIGEPCRITPATAWGCKRFGVDHNRGVTDSLLRLELSAALRAEGRKDWTKPMDDIAACPECQTEYQAEPSACPRDRLQAPYAERLNPDFVVRKVRRTLRTGTAVDRSTGAVASGMLFSQQAVESGQRFSGKIWLDDELAEHLTERLQEILPEDGTLYLGYGRSRGFGQVKVSYQMPNTAKEPLAQRLQWFDRTVNRLWKHYQLEPPAQRYFSLLLVSHLAMCHTSGKPLLEDLQPKDLGLPWVSTWREAELAAVAVPGWNSAWSLPKADTWALKRGSVLLGRFAPEDETAVSQRLATLEMHGCGARRAEGFGRLRVCDEFHYVYTRQEL